ncbi:MAG: V-type ATP synthase subunit F [Methanomassiliicoccales archaeon]|nr:V-type ATP synthase subunit F [Methanomassiliicoccales archaeon]
MEIAVLGSEEFILGFRLAGVTRVYRAEGIREFEEKLLELLQDTSIGVLAIDSSILEKLGASTRKKVLENIAPVVVPVGHEEGDLRDKVKRAIGVDLYKTQRD